MRRPSCRTRSLRPCGWWTRWDLSGTGTDIERRATDVDLRRLVQADPFWHQSAQDLLVGLFRAAYYDGGTVRDVMKWLSDPREKAPMRILYEHEAALAEQVEASVNIAEETQSGIFQNARTAMSALRDERSWPG